MRTNNTALTLVELIVMITILGILLTIAMINLSWHGRTSRDSLRISDVSSIGKALELYALDYWEYPNPTDYTTVTYSWANVWNQWIFSGSVLKDIERLSNIPLDPLTNNGYAYSINRLKSKYQLATSLEWWVAHFNMVNSSYADWKIYWTAFVKWNYLWVVTDTQTGSTTYLLAVPSIIASDLSIPNLIDIVSNKKLVYNGKKNLPANYNGSMFNVDWGFDFTPNELLVYSGPIFELQDDHDKRLSFIENVKASYVGTSIAREANIRSITRANLRNTLKADVLAISLIWWWATPTGHNSPTITFLNPSGAVYRCVACD